MRILPQPRTISANADIGYQFQAIACLLCAIVVRWWYVAFNAACVYGLGAP